MNPKKTVFLLFLFSIAMGYMEGAIVVYLREIFYPNGFDFPLEPITSGIALTEVLREAATMVMLLTIALLTGRTGTEKFGFFVFCFGIWDIVYYITLYFLLGWPESLLTWDILFLIPVTWVGPVLGPVINSLTMILLALLISRFTTQNPATRIIGREWLLLIAGALIVIVSYTEDYVSFMLEKFSFGAIFDPSKSDDLMDSATGYIPERFAWWIFAIGETLILSGVWLFHRRHSKRYPNTD
jgi:hypothetical protein